MTDYFALLGEARQPWLDAEKLKEKYFALSRGAPPSAEVNEAFRVLNEPKLRLQHFLQLQGADLAVGRAVPHSVAELFWSTGELLREIDRFVLREQAAASDLARAVLSAEKAKLQNLLGELEAELGRRYEQQLADLAGRRFSPNDDLELLIERFDTLAYLTRLREQAAAKNFRLGLQ